MPQTHIYKIICLSQIILYIFISRLEEVQNILINKPLQHVYMLIDIFEIQAFMFKSVALQFFSMVEEFLSVMQE